jgi:hypothetical protein
MDKVHKPITTQYYFWVLILVFNSHFLVAAFRQDLFSRVYIKNFADL